MDLHKIARSTTGTLKQNSPAILAGVGVGGVVATGILAARGGMKAQQLMWEDHSTGGVSDDRKYQLKKDAKLTWKCYIPAASVGATTIAAIIAGNSVSTRRQAAVVSLATVTERAFKEYKDEVVKVLGEEKEQKIEESASAKLLASNPMQDGAVIIGAGKVICYESLSGRYFETDYESIRAAQNDLNAQCLNSVYASQNDWYKLLGLPPLANGDELGWNSDHRLDARITSTMTPDNKPALCIKYGNNPSPNYYKGHGWM